MTESSGIRKTKEKDQLSDIASISSKREVRRRTILDKFEQFWINLDKKDQFSLERIKWIENVRLIKRLEVFINNITILLTNKYLQQ